MVHQLLEFEDGKVATTGSVFHLPNLSCPGLPHRVGREVLYLQGVLDPDFLKVSVDSLDGIDSPLVANKARLLPVGNLQGVEAFLDVLLETPVDTDDSPLAGFLLVQHKALLVKTLIPGQGAKVRNSQPEEAAATDKETEPVIPIIVEFPNQSHCRVPFQVISRCVGVSYAHYCLNLCDCEYPRILGKGWFYVCS